MKSLTTKKLAIVAISSIAALSLAACGEETVVADSGSETQTAVQTDESTEKLNKAGNLDQQNNPAEAQPNLVEAQTDREETQPDREQFVKTFTEAVLSGDVDALNKLSTEKTQDSILHSDADYSNNKSLENLGKVILYKASTKEATVLKESECTVPDKDQCEYDLYDAGDSYYSSTIVEGFNSEKLFDEIKEDFRISNCDQTIDNEPGFTYESCSYWVFGIVDGEYRYIGNDVIG